MFQNSVPTWGGRGGVSELGTMSLKISFFYGTPKNISGISKEARKPIFPENF